MNNQNKHFVIFGGAGYVGIFLVKYIQQKFPDCKITVITRNLTKKIFFRESNVKIINNVKTLVDENLVLINLAYFLGKTFKETQKGNIDLFHKIETVIKNNTIQSFVHVSSIVLNDYNYPKLTTAKVKKKNIYYYAKSIAEQKVNYLSKKYSVQSVILRSGNIIGPGSIWIDKITNRLLMHKPLIGLQKDYPSNATFVGNLCFGIIEMSTRKLEQQFLIINFAELGDIPWSKIIESVNKVLNQEIKFWNLNNVDDVKVSLINDFVVAFKNSFSTFLLTFSKGIESNLFITKTIGLLNLKNVDKKAKRTVKSINKTNKSNFDASEYNLLSVFVNKTKCHLENVPSSLIKNIPFPYSYIEKSIGNWLDLAGYTKS